VLNTSYAPISIATSKAGSSASANRRSALQVLEWSPAHKGDRLKIFPFRSSACSALFAISFLIFVSPAYAQPTSSSVAVIRTFEGTSMLDNCALGQCFIAPHPMGAIGTTQFLETTTGSITFYDKATAAVLSRVSMTTFWSTVFFNGNSLGNQRVLFDHHTNRWIMSGFGSTLNKVNIAISDTADALGTWRGGEITVLASSTAVADDPTLSLDEKGVYIATDNFDPNFTGTTLLVIPKADLFNGAPTLANMTTITSPVTGPDKGFVIQPALNWQGNPTNTSFVFAASRDFYQQLFYKISGVNAAGATQSASTLIAGSNFIEAGDGRQPDGTRTVPTLTGRTEANAAQSNGKVFAVDTVKSALGDYAAVRWTVLDAGTGVLLSSGKIEQAGYDYYHPTIAVNEFGEAIIAYNRSGFAQGDGNGDGLDDGNISFLARAYDVNGNFLVQDGTEMLLRVSPISDYHCGTRAGPNSCRQRWGHPGAVTIDPGDHHKFYAIGQYAADWAALPGSGSVRAIWRTHIAEIAMIQPIELLFSDGFE